MADNRVVKVTLRAQIAEYKKGMQEAAQATETAAQKSRRELQELEDQLQEVQDASQMVGRALVVAGTAMVGATAMAVKAAAEWESAWAGVTKTVDGTDAQLSTLEQGLRDLTGVLPASHEEIAAVAEAAGQLGIETESVTSFTKTMIDLGETTNLSSDQAATSLARFMNIMGTSQSEVSRLGSALVGLGNNYATTEAEIMEMSMRLAGAGRQIGLSEGEVLGLATSLSSVGIEAEAGGSAISKVMIDIAASVANGGDRLEQFADVAGMGADEFAKKWRSAPAEALSAFVKGLSNAESQGSSTLGVLEDLGITEVRMRDALLRSSAAADLFAGAMAQGNEEFELNNALTAEAAKRYETVESKIAIAGNAIKDAAISFGEVLLPVVAAAAEGVADFAKFMGGLPEPLKVAVTILGGVAGVVALIGGAALLAIPQVARFKESLQILGITGGAVRSGLGGVSRFLMGPWGIAIGLAVTAIGALSRAAEEGAATQAELENAVVNVSDATELLRTGDKGFWFSELDSVIDDVDEFRAALENMSNNNWFDDNEESTALANSFKNISSALGPLVTSDLPAAQKAFKTLAERYELTVREQAMMLEKMPEYRDALIQQATALGINLTGLSETERAYRLVELATGDTIPLVERFNEALEGDSVMGVVESMAAFGFAAAGVKDDSDKAVDGLDGVEDGLGGVEEAAESAEDRIARLSDIIRGFGSVTLDAREAARRLEQAYDDLADSVYDNGTTLDVTTQAGRDNEDALDAIAKAARDNAAAILENTGSQEQATAAMQLGREELIRQLEQFGITGAEADAYADKLGLIPSNITTDAEFRKMAAEAAIEAWVAKWSGTRIYFDVVANTSPIAVPSGGSVAHFAGGMYSNGVQEFATGGFPSGVYDGVNGGIHKFAEKEKGVKWEAYISGRAADRDRNVGIAFESLRRMGVNGGGGSTTTVSAPITVQAVPGMSEEQVGLAAAEKLNYALRG
mgnify:FL=1